MIKVLHVISSLKRGGRERQVAILVSNMVGPKDQLSILVFYDVEGSYINEYGLKNNILKLKKETFWGRLFELRGLVEEEKPDIVYTWGNIESLLILLLYPYSKFIFINGSIRHGVLSKTIKGYFRCLILHFSQFIVANSYAGLKANIFNPDKRRFIMYNGVDNKFRIALSPLEKGKLKEIIIPYFSKNPGIVFITVANLVPYKDYFTVLRALRLFKKTHDFYYLIVGGGPLKKEIESLIKDYMLENQIVMIDGTENVRDYLLISDLMIHSSRGEGISNAILEGMYSGLPVIATNVGGIPETVYRSEERRVGKNFRSRWWPYK